MSDVTLRHASVSACILIVSVSCGCASSEETTADQQYERMDARLEAISDFENLQKICEQLGGVVYVDRRGAGRFPPTTTEIRSARCTTGAASL